MVVYDCVWYFVNVLSVLFFSYRYYDCYNMAEHVFVFPIEQVKFLNKLLFGGET